MTYSEWKHNTIIYERTKNEMKHEWTTFFPALADMIAGSWQMVFPIMLERWSSEEKLYNPYIKNIDLNIYENRHFAPNAYTWPMAHNKLVLQGLAFGSIRENFPILKAIFPFEIIVLLYSTLGTIFIPLTLKNASKTGIVTFNKVPYSIGAVQMAGLADVVPDTRERLSVILHEIGHWVYGSKALIGAYSHLMAYLVQINTGMLVGLGIASGIIQIIFVALLLLSLFYMRSAEWASDKFVKDCGYGNELANALERISFMKNTIRHNKSGLVVIHDAIYKVLNDIINIVDDYLPIFGHPSVKKRAKVLREHYNYPYTYIPLTEVDQYILTEGVFSLLKDKLISLLSPIDKLAAKNFSALFPLVTK